MKTDVIEELIEASDPAAIKACVLAAEEKVLEP
jgi:hypothetical protein